MADKLRLGLIGASTGGATWSSRSHLPAAVASDDVDLVAVCTTKTQTAEAARKEYDAKLAFNDYEEMCASPEIDTVTVAIRVPNHYGPVKAALEAGKHVYCEWPLGRTTAEAEELTELAASKGLKTCIGLHGRANAEIRYIKDLIEQGYVGEVMSVHVHLSREGVLKRPSHRMWQMDASLGANPLTIANGHAIDPMRFAVGDFGTFSAIVANQARQWLDTGTNTPTDVTSPDHIVTCGRLQNGAVVTTDVVHAPFAGDGYRLQIIGREGTLMATGHDTPQHNPLLLLGAQGSNDFKELETPGHYTIASAGKPEGEAYNVSQNYSRFAQTIHGGEATHATFETAVGLHRLIDKISESSETGRTVTHG